MSAKMHLLDSAEPVIGGRELTANCGAKVLNAQFGFVWDEQRMGAGVELDGLKICSKCRNLAFDHAYVYGIYRGEIVEPRPLPRDAHFAKSIRPNADY